HLERFRPIGCQEDGSNEVLVGREGEALVLNRSKACSGFRIDEKTQLSRTIGVVARQGEPVVSLRTVREDAESLHVDADACHSRRPSALVTLPAGSSLTDQDTRVEEWTNLGIWMRFGKLHHLGRRVKSVRQLRRRNAIPHRPR